MDAGQIIASLSLAFQDFRSGLTAAVTEAKRAGQQMQDAFNRIDNAGANANKSAKDLGFSFKDLGRIVSGIVISQIFYQSIQTIKDATSAVIEFSMEMERAQVSFTKMLGSSDAATGFIENIKNLAAVSDFSTQQVVTLARRLMAFGVSAKQVTPIMKILADETAYLGGSDYMLQHIVMSISQLANAAKPSVRELKELSLQGVQVNKYLREAGLEAANIAKSGKSGAEVANIILRGMQKESAGMVQILANTTTGMINTIKDDFLMIGSEIAGPIMGKFKIFLTTIRDTFDKVRTLIRDGGIGNALNKMLPPNLANAVRTIVGAVKQLYQAFMTLARAVYPIVQAIGGALLQALAIVLPPLVKLVTWIVNLFKVALAVIPGLRLLIIAIGFLLIVNLVSTAFIGFIKVIRLLYIIGWAIGLIQKLMVALQALYALLVAHPLVLLLMLIAAAATYTAYKLGALDGIIKKVQTSFGKLTKIDTSKILQPIDTSKIKDTMADFNQQFTGIEDGLNEAGDAAEKNGKKVEDKFIASFDEVFQVPEKLDDAAGAMDNVGKSGDTSGLDDLNDGLNDIQETIDDLEDGTVIPFDWVIPPIPAIGDIIGPLPDLVPELVPDFAKAVEPVRDWIEDLIGDLAGELEGVFDPVKDAIGDLAGELGKALRPVGGLLKDIIKQLQDAAKPVKDAIGDAATAVDGWLKDLVAKLKEAAGLVGDAIGDMFPKGVVSDWLSDVINGLKDAANQAQGALGGLVPSGALSGFQQALKDIWGQLTNLAKPWVVSVLYPTFDAFVKQLKAIGKAIGEAFSMDPVKEAVKDLIEAIGQLTPSWDAIQAGAAKVSNALFGFNIFSWAADRVGDLGKAFSAIKWGEIGTTIMNGVKSVWNPVANYFTSIDWSGIGKNIQVGFNTALDGIKSFGASAWNSIASFVGSAGKAISNWASTAGTAISSFTSSAWNNISTWASSAWGAISNWASNAGTTISNWASNAKNVLSSFGSIAGAAIKSFASTAWKNITEAFGKIGDAIWNVVKEIPGILWEGLQAAASKVGDFFVWIGNWLKDNWQSVLKGVLVAVLVAAVVFAFVTGIGEVATAIGAFVSAIGTRLASGFAGVALLGGKSGLLTPVMDKIKEGLDWLWKVISDWGTKTVGPFFQDLWKNIAKWTSDAWDGIKTKLGKDWDEIKTTVSKWCSDIGKFFQDIWKNITKWTSDTWTDLTKNMSKWTSDIWNTIKTWGTNLGKSISDIWTSITKATQDAWNNITKWLSDTWNKVTSTVANWGTGLANTFTNIWNNIKTGATNLYNSFLNIFSGIADKLGNLLSGVPNTFKRILNAAIDFVNGCIRGLNRVRFTIPAPLPGAGTTVGFSLPLIPRLASGGVVMRETLAQLGEKNKKEAVIPLENRAAIQPLINAIMDNFKQMMAQGKMDAATTRQQIVLQVGTLIGDNRSMAELERKLANIRLQEVLRRG